MSAWPRIWCLAVVCCLPISPTVAQDSRYGFGREPTATEIMAYDIDVRADGAGLPDGSGTVDSGEAIYVERCAACHGDFGEGIGNQPPLMGGVGMLSGERAIKTVGNFWPYAPPLWDYVYRTMPFGDAQSLTADETYGLVAYLLYLNDLVDSDFVADRRSLPEVEMPNRDGFMADDRATEPWRGVAPCMTNCRDSVRITGAANRLDVTPAGGNN